MVRKLALALVAMVGALPFATPSQALILSYNPPLCDTPNGWVTHNKAVVLGWLRGAGYNVLETKDVEELGGCARAFVRLPDGGQKMVIVDPYSLQLVREL